MTGTRRWPSAGAGPRRRDRARRAANCLGALAGLVALPAFAIGAELDAALGVKGVIEASLGGGAILACVAVLAAIAGAQVWAQHLCLDHQRFRIPGREVVNFVLAAVLLGWFGVTLTMFASSATQGLHSLGLHSSTADVGGRRVGRHDHDSPDRVSRHGSGRADIDAR